MINLTLTEEEARTIFSALNSYRITHALSMMETYPKEKITKDNLIKELDSLIETLYYKIPKEKEQEEQE